MIKHCECNSGFALKSWQLPRRMMTASSQVNSLTKCVRFDVLEDSTVGVKIAELLRLNVSTSIDEQFSLKVAEDCRRYLGSNTSIEW